MDLQDLTFNKEGDLWVCEFEAAGPFNIKITRANVPGAYGALPGTLSMQQSLTGEDYVPVPLPPAWPLMEKLDFEVPNVPEGMHIRIESGAEVTTAKIAYQS